MVDGVQRGLVVGQVERYHLHVRAQLVGHVLPPVLEHRLGVLLVIPDRVGDLDEYDRRTDAVDLLHLRVVAEGPHLDHRDQVGRAGRPGQLGAGRVLEHDHAGPKLHRLGRGVLHLPELHLIVLPDGDALQQVAVDLAISSGRGCVERLGREPHDGREHSLASDARPYRAAQERPLGPDVLPGLLHPGPQRHLGVLGHDPQPPADVRVLLAVLVPHRQAIHAVEYLAGRLVELLPQVAVLQGVYERVYGDLRGRVVRPGGGYVDHAVLVAHDHSPL